MASSFECHNTKKRYLVNVLSTHKIFSSRDVVFEKPKSSALAYTPRPYSGSLAVRPSLSYITYDTSYHEETGNIKTFAQFEEENLVENELNTEEERSILDSIDESYPDDESDDGIIGMNALKEIWDGSQIHPDLNTRDDIFKISDRIRQTQNEWK